MDIATDIHPPGNLRPALPRALPPALTLVISLVIALLVRPVGIGGTEHAAPKRITHQAAVRLVPGQPALAPPPLAPGADTAPSSARLDGEGTAELLDEVGPALVDIDTDTAGGTEAGTGIVLTARGLVLTNAHVIADAVDLHATDLGDGRTYPAEVVGVDLTHDIALIQLVGAAGLRTATLGDSDTLRVGDQVASIGNADGLGRLAIGAGPIVHLDRRIASTTDPDPDAEPLSGLIEARSWIRPGESGGPMVDRAGEVIGINVAYATTADGVVSPRGYAIPINRAVHIARELLAENGR